MTKTKDCDAKTLAVIAAQFIALGYDEEEAFQKANAIYRKATAYAKKFASLPPDENEFEAFSEEAIRALGDDLAIGNSEANSPALEYFRATATTKQDRYIGHKGFLGIIKRFHDHRPEAEKTKRDKDGNIIPWAPQEKIGRGVIDDLHDWLRADRSKARSKRREKSVEKNLEAG